MIFLHRTVLALLFGSLAGGFAARGAFAQNTSLPADEIYARALWTWAAQPSPAVLAYRVTARLVHKGRLREERERVVLRTADRNAIVQKIEIDKTGSERVVRVVFERPRFDPDVTFRLVPRSRVDETDDAKAPADARTIARVVARAKRYAVALVGERAYRDRRVYELRLTPLFDPRTNSVREMYVDTENFVTWRVLNEAPYAVGPAHGTFLLDAEYAPVGSAWLISRVTTSGTMRFGPFAYGGDGDVEYRMLDTPVNVPAYCFSRNGYNGHAVECAASTST